MRSIWIMLLVFPTGLDLLSETYMTEKTLLPPGNSCWNILNKSQLTAETKHAAYQQIAMYVYRSISCNSGHWSS